MELGLMECGGVRGGLGDGIRWVRKIVGRGEKERERMVINKDKGLLLLLGV